MGRETAANGHAEQSQCGWTSRVDTPARAPNMPPADQRCTRIDCCVHVPDQHPVCMSQYGSISRGYWLTQVIVMGSMTGGLCIHDRHLDQVCTTLQTTVRKHHVRQLGIWWVLTRGSQPGHDTRYYHHDRLLQHMHATLVPKRWQRTTESPRRSERAKSTKASRLSSFCSHSVTVSSTSGAQFQDMAKGLNENKSADEDDD